MWDESVARRFREALPAGLAFCSLRLVDERTEVLSVRNDVVEPPQRSRDVGAMVTVHHGGGLGYAATGDLSASGLREAVGRARRWAEVTAQRAVFDPRTVEMSAAVGEYRSPVATPWTAQPLPERLERLVKACAAAKVDPRIVERSSSVMAVDTDVTYLTSAGGSIRQEMHHVSPEVEVFAHEGGRTQRRTLGGLRGASQQGGAEVLDRFAFDSQAVRVGRQAVELLDAADCPSGKMDLLLAPDQMMLQIHESIGHPIELDRILGDERNYAGTSFVTLDMFGSFQYGSELLNVSFDPELSEQLASYGFDDDGARARRVLLIDKGVLMRPLGGTISQARAGMAGVANARAESWNRPPIDRMANLNVEPGDSPFEDLVGRVERGMYMETNLSWSIDDSRNKFQFGCEYAREIVDGRLGRVVRNPNYRGISASFWRNLVGVGDRSTFQVLGTPYCGKGEPNQVIRVGHASPACLFAGVDVFGGHA
jgi:predicted Zn-dependent protease